MIIDGLYKMQQENSELQREVKSLRSQLEELECVVLDLEEQIGDLIAENENLEDGLEYLRCRLADKDSNIVDVNRDPDPYELHGIPLANRLIAMGFPL